MLIIVKIYSIIVEVETQISVSRNDQYKHNIHVHNHGNFTRPVHGDNGKKLDQYW